MAFDIGSVITGALAPIGNIIDELHTSKEEKAAMKIALVNAQGSLQNELASFQKDIIIAEAKGESSLQRNWRPILMLTIVAIVANNYILYPYLSLFWRDAPTLDLPQALWNLMQIGVGGYIVGRSGEKMINTWKGNGKS